MYPIHISYSSSISCTAPLHDKSHGDRAKREREKTGNKQAAGLCEGAARTRTQTQEDQSLNNRGCDDDTQQHHSRRA